MYVSALRMTGILRHFLGTVVQDSGRCDVVEGAPTQDKISEPPLCTLLSLL